jgi:acyl-coenzyme A synthetase/AMP-(fatty) acid ligase
MESSVLKKIISVIPINSLEYIDFMFRSFHGDATVVHQSVEESREFNFDHEMIEAVTIEDSKGWYKGQQYQVLDSADIAQVIYTSGTEGKPKGVLLSHRALGNTAQRLIDVMEMNSSIKEYVGVPVHYSFGFGRCRAVSLVGGSFFIPGNGFDPFEILSMLEKDEINAISAVPSLWRVLLEVANIFSNVQHKVKWIEVGSQYMSGDEKTALKTLFPSAKIIQHYGLSEASRSTFLKIHEKSQDINSVGLAQYGVEVALTEFDTLKIKGPHVSSGLLINGNIESITNEDGWVVTNDKCVIKDDFIYFLGRADDVINCGGIKVSPELIESELYKALSIDSGLAVFKGDNHFTGEVPLLAIDKRCSCTPEVVYQKFVEILFNKNINISKKVEVYKLDTLPQTDTGKVKRAELSKQYVLWQKENEAILENVDLEDEVNIEEKIITIWKYVLNVEHVSVNDTFNDLGGDSLSTLRVMIKMEAAGIESRVAEMMLKGYSIKQIVEANDRYNKQPAITHEPLVRSEAANNVLTVNVLRGLLVFANIMAHWHGGLIARLPIYFLEINKLLSPIYSSGTPGFALIFGVGLGAFGMPRIIGPSKSFKNLIYRNSSILLIGIILLATLKIALLFVEDKITNAVDVSNAFYSVIFYYFFAVITLPILLRLLYKTPNFGKSCLVTLILFYFIHMIIDASPITSSSNPLIQPFILLIKAKYNYFEMSAGALFGVLIGYYVIAKPKYDFVVNNLYSIGLVLIVSAIIISIEAGQQAMWFSWPASMHLWSWLFYAGVIILAFKHLSTYLGKNNYQQSKIIELLVNIFAVFGVLAFPLFIGHALVIPLKDLLEYFHIPLPYIVSLGLFTSIFTYYFRKVYLTFYKH